jgi:hypothetical protein
MNQPRPKNPPGPNATGEAGVREQVERLRTILATSPRFSEACDYFHDHLATNLEFLGMGEPKANRMLELACETAAQRAFGADAKLIDAAHVHVPAFKMWHGFCRIDSRKETRLGVVFYFDDTSQGLLVAPNPRSKNSDLIRFGMVVLPYAGMRDSVGAAPPGHPRNPGNRRGQC